MWWNCSCLLLEGFGGWGVEKEESGEILQHHPCMDSRFTKLAKAILNHICLGAWSKWEAGGRRLIRAEVISPKGDAAQEHARVTGQRQMIRNNWRMWDGTPTRDTTERDKRQKLIAGWLAWTVQIEKVKIIYMLLIILSVSFSGWTYLRGRQVWLFGLWKVPET